MPVEAKRLRRERGLPENQPVQPNKTLADGWAPASEGVLMRIPLYAPRFQQDQGPNPETQLRQLREHAAVLDGAVLVGDFVDEASDDDLRGRHRWREILELAQNRQLDFILVWRLDRAFRSVHDGATTLGHHRAWGCGLRSLQEPRIDTTTPIGEAMFHITIAWAGLEMQTLSERMRAGMERAHEEGTQLAGRGGKRGPLTHGSPRSMARSSPEYSPKRRASAASRPVRGVRGPPD